MNKAKTSLILLLMLCTSCVTSPPTRIITERCFPSFEYGKARCHKYELGREGFGRVGESYNMPLEYINKRAVFTDWPTIWKYLEEWRLYLKDQESRKESHSNQWPSENDDY